VKFDNLFSFISYYLLFLPTQLTSDSMNLSQMMSFD